jgi:excisionase family DNA binding protein
VELNKIIDDEKDHDGEPSPEAEDSAIAAREELLLTLDRLLTVEEVAQLIQFAAKSIYQLVHRRKIPYIKISGALRFRRSDIETWIEENTFKPQLKTKSEKVSRPKARKSSRKLTDVDRIVEQSRRKYLDG